jgi:hypothetical protein
VIVEAIRSMPECAASESSPREPVSRPVISLSSETIVAATTEKTAAARLAV